jgi:hypothetical protein
MMLHSASGLRDSVFSLPMHLYSSAICSRLYIMRSNTAASGMQIPASCSASFGTNRTRTGSSCWVRASYLRSCNATESNTKREEKFLGATLRAYLDRIKGSTESEMGIADTGHLKKAGTKTCLQNGAYLTKLLQKHTETSVGRTHRPSALRQEVSH